MKVVGFNEIIIHWEGKEGKIKEVVNWKDLPHGYQAVDKLKREGLGGIFWTVFWEVVGTCLGVLLLMLRGF